MNSIQQKSALDETSKIKINNNVEEVFAVMEVSDDKKKQKKEQRNNPKSENIAKERKPFDNR